MEELQPDDGILLVDKPQNYSSHDVINLLRKALDTRKIGHSGTLDPMATGLLVLLVGRQATRRQDHFLQLHKTYSATLTLGQGTDTWDAYGDWTDELPVPTFTLADVQRITAGLTGQVRQPIPAFCAKKIRGQKMYDLARKGAELEQRYNTVQVFAWTNVEIVSPTQISFTVECGCGTYIRSLGYMIATALGTTGHISQLRRERIGRLDVMHALDGALIKTIGVEALRGRFLEASYEA